MADNSVIFKVFLRSDGSPEARKFIIDDASVITSYIFIKGKLAMIFPKLNNNAFKITWKDTEGDEITIDSDEDLIMAFTEMTGPVKTFYVTLLSSNQPATPVSNVYCDGCNKPITGYRYKCLQCPDFDLCIECEHNGFHTEHYMLRSSNGELPFAPTCRRIAENINKAVRKAQAISYKEACRNTKGHKKFDKKYDHHNKYERGCKYDQAGTSSCPVTAPIFDFVNAAAQAAYTGFSAPANPGPQENKESQAPPQQHLMEVMMKALNTMFTDPKPSTSAEEPTKTPTTTPVNEQATQQDKASSEQPPTPMEEDSEHVRTPGRSSSWTILNNDVAILNQEHEIPSAPSEPPLDPKILAGLKQLRDMGFDDHPNVVTLLKRYDGNVGNVIRHMFDNI